MSSLNFENFQKVFEIYNDKGNVRRGKINNRFSDEFDSSIVCDIRGIETPALYEIHVFLMPIWNKIEEIDSLVISNYQKVVEIYNNVFRNTYFTYKEMGAPVLTLIFNKTNEVTVLQSSQYYPSNDIKDVIKVTHYIADMFSKCGFDVIREKIEVMTNGCIGIPLDFSVENRYFEYHINF